MNSIRKQKVWPVTTALFVIAAFAGILVCDCCEVLASETVQIQKTPCHSCCAHDMSIQTSCSDAVNRVQSTQVMPSQTEKPGSIFENKFSAILPVSTFQLDSTAEGPPGLPGSSFAPQPIYLSLLNLRI